MAGAVCPKVLPLVAFVLHVVSATLETISCANFLVFVFSIFFFFFFALVLFCLCFCLKRAKQLERLFFPF